MSTHANAENNLGNEGHNPTDSVQFVTFFLSEREFGVDIQSVREIKGWQQTTALPSTPPYVLGAINLRGQIIAVYDLRQRLGIGSTEAGDSHVVVVVEIGERSLGLLADSVSDILTIDSASIRPVPVSGGNREPLLTGLIAKGEKMVSLLDLECIAGNELGRGDDGEFDDDEKRDAA